MTHLAADGDLIHDRGTGVTEMYALTATEREAAVLLGHGNHPRIRCTRAERALIAALVAWKGQGPMVCPKCNGQGTVSKPPWIAGDVTTWNSHTTAPYVCNLCEGRMVIGDRAAEDTQ